MSSGYTVTDLKPDDAQQSYALLVGPAPAVMLDKWQRFCSPHREFPKRDILVARNAAGYMQGLCAYYEIDHISRGRLLEVPIFVVASAADPAGVTNELVRALKNVCKERDCAAVRVGLANSWRDADLLACGEYGEDNAIYVSPKQQ
jgi:hypothetical protein